MKRTKNKYIKNLVLAGRLIRPFLFAGLLMAMSIAGLVQCGKFAVTPGPYGYDNYYYGGDYGFDDDFGDDFGDEDGFGDDFDGDEDDR